MKANDAAFTLARSDPTSKMMALSWLCSSQEVSLTISSYKLALFLLYQWEIHCHISTIDTSSPNMLPSLSRAEKINTFCLALFFPPKNVHCYLVILLKWHPFLTLIMELVFVSTLYTSNMFTLALERYRKSFSKCNLSSHLPDVRWHTQLISTKMPAIGTQNFMYKVSRNCTMWMG